MLFLHSAAGGGCRIGSDRVEEQNCKDLDSAKQEQDGNKFRATHVSMSLRYSIMQLLGDKLITNVVEERYIYDNAVGLQID